MVVMLTAAVFTGGFAGDTAGEPAGDPVGETAGSLAGDPVGDPVGPAEVPGGQEVTLRGVVVCSAQCAVESKIEDPTADEHNYLVLYAFDGTPEVRAALDAVMEECYPEGGLDVEQARRLQAEMDARIRYMIEPGPVAEANHEEVEWRSLTMAVTGTVFERDGRRWISPTRMEQTALAYPARMLAPDRPLVMPGETPLMLEIDDDLSLKCILLPAGRFLHGSPFYQQKRWQDEYPKEVVLTKSFYMAEHPITQEIFEAVMGRNPSIRRDPEYPVERVPYADIQEFCRILSERNGRTVRLATDAEWEYAARVGTSSPCFTEKYRDQISNAGNDRGNPQPVRTRQPNAWGLYDMLSAGWEVVSDWKADNVRVDQVDPQGPPVTDPHVQDYGNGPLHKAKGGGYYEDYRPNMHGAVDADGMCAEGNAIFRVVAEAELR